MDNSSIDNNKRQRPERPSPPSLDHASRTVDEESTPFYVGQNKTLTGNYRDIASHDYSEFLGSRSFHWFCTFTFAESKHPESADKVFRLWMNNLNRDLFGKRWNQKGDGVLWVRALEWQKRGVLHYHVLLAFPEYKNLNRDAFSYSFRKHYALHWRDDLKAGIARIDEIRGDQNAVRTYLTKYVTKDGELDFSHNYKDFAYV